MTSSEVFNAWRREPSRETLVQLLKESQAAVYNLCFQVLRHRQDAEDAAQRVLLDLLGEIGQITGPDHYRGWLHRACLLTALNLRRGERRRMRYERTPREVPPPALSDEDLDLLHERIADLDDDARSLIIGHFFERRSLEDLGRERGCSPVAIWKRIEKAKASLKQSLKELVSSSAMAAIDPVLGSLRPAATSRDLISGTILEKAGLVAAGVKTGAAATWGGAAATAKGLSVGAVGALSSLMLLMGAGGGVLIGISHPASVSHGFAAMPPVTVAGGTPSSAEGLAPERGGASSSPSEDLQAGLSRLRRRIAELNQAIDQNSRTGSPENRSRLNDLNLQLIAEWRLLRPRVYGDPATYFAFLRAPDSVAFTREFLTILRTGSFFYGSEQPDQTATFAELPAPLHEGLADLYTLGTKAQRFILLDFLALPPDRGLAAMTGRILESLRREQDPEIVGKVLRTYCWAPENEGRSWLEDRLDLVDEIWRTAAESGVRHAAIELLSRLRTPAAEALFVQRTEETLREKGSKVTPYLPDILRPKLKSLRVGEEDRYLPVLALAVRGTSQPDLLQSFVRVSLELPPAKAQGILEQAQAHCPSATLGKRIAHVLELLQSGETRRDFLQSVLSEERHP